MVILIIITDTTMLLPDIMEAEDIGVMTAITIEIILIIIMIMVFLTIMTVTTTPEEKCMWKEGLPPPPRDLTTVSEIITDHTIIIAEDSIITETPTVTAVSETRTTREIRITKTETGSEIRTAAATADSEIKTAVLRTTKIIVDSETKAVPDQNHLPAGSEITQTAKAAMPTDRATEEASDNLDKTIINKETNS